jgi:hypothetical protein
MIIITYQECALKSHSCTRNNEVNSPFPSSPLLPLPLLPLLEETCFSNPDKLKFLRKHFNNTLRTLCQRGILQRAWCLSGV